MASFSPADVKAALLPDAGDDLVSCFCRTMVFKVLISPRWNS